MNKDVRPFYIYKPVMLKIGNYNQLEIVKEVEFGMYLASDQGEILIPKKWVKEEWDVGDIIEVFIYTDSEDRLIATTLKPFAKVGDFVAMDVKQVTGFGAFLDWGIEKDLLVPLREQHRKLEEGQRCVVKVCLDHKTNRVIGVAKLSAFINKDVQGLQEGDQVELLIYDATDLGMMAMINHEFAGMLYKNEIFEPVKIGDKRIGYIKKIREDGKIDLSLKPSGYKAVLGDQEGVLEALEKAGGFLPLHDKSDPEEIRKAFNLSKKAFKKVIGTLYKEGRILILPEGIRLTGLD